jgi:hypothetical protein
MVIWFETAYGGVVQRNFGNTFLLIVPRHLSVYNYWAGILEHRSDRPSGGSRRIASLSDRIDLGFFQCIFGLIDCLLKDVCG